MFLIHGGKIAIYRTQYQYITFVTDIAQNNVGTFHVIPKDLKTLQP